jgi:hypothetical protein
MSYADMDLIMEILRTVTMTDSNSRVVSQKIRNHRTIILYTGVLRDHEEYISDHDDDYDTTISHVLSMLRTNC